MSEYEKAKGKIVEYSSLIAATVTIFLMFWLVDIEEMSEDSVYGFALFVIIAPMAVFSGVHDSVSFLIGYFPNHHNLYYQWKLELKKKKRERIIKGLNKIIRKK